MAAEHPENPPPQHEEPEATKPPKPRSKGRRWARRLTYLLAAGGALAGGSAWLLHQSFVGNYAIQKLGELVVDETGLAFEARSLDIGLFSGLVAINDVHLGQDLLTIRRVEVQADFLSLLGDHPHIRRVTILGPEAHLDEKRIQGLKFKKHPPRQNPLQFKLGRLELKDGSIEIREPKWKLPEARAKFSAKGNGLGPNQVRIEFKTSDMVFKAPGGTAKGQAELTADLSETFLRLLKAEAELGSQRLEVHGTYEPDTHRISAKAKATLDLSPALKLAQSGAKTTGRVALDLAIEGETSKPAWDLRLLTKDLDPGTQNLKPGSLELKASGTLKEAKLKTLTWHSEDGDLALEGEWKKGTRTKVVFKADHVDLNPLAEFSRVSQANDLQAFMEGDAELPADPWDWNGGLNRINAKATGHIQRMGSSAGDFSASLNAGVLSLTPLNLHLEDLELKGRASGKLGPRGVENLQAEGSVETDAARVAVALKSWNVVNLEMGGRVNATATLSYRQPEGLLLNGSVMAEKPRWHGATADRLSANVRIVKNALDIQDIVVERNTADAQGRGYGDIWLTWADQPPGSKQFDACFRASRLPVSEGLKAADLGDLPLDGTGSGWARIWGPFDALEMDANGLVEKGTAYTLNVPAAFADFHMDITTLRISLPEFRIAESVPALALTESSPTGLLAVQGNLELDPARNSWWGSFRGAVDSSQLAIPGPRVQAEVEGKVDGPWAVPFGPASPTSKEPAISLPSGQVSFKRGRIFAGDQSLENLEGMLRNDRGSLEAWVGQGGAGPHILDLGAWNDEGTLRAGGHLRLDEATVDTPRLAARITQDLMTDLRLESDISATWEPEGFHWVGRANQLLARFPAFDLTQAQPSYVHGNLTGAQLDLSLEAQERIGSRPAEAKLSTGSLSLTGLVPFTTKGPLVLDAKGSADLGELKTILDSLMEVDPYSLLADFQPSGITKVDLQIQGTVLEPQLEGSLHLDRGRIAVRSFPQSAEGITATVHFHGREVSISQSDPLRGSLAQGNLTTWGTLTWQPGGLASYDMKLGLEDFQLRDVPVGFEVSGNLEARISGNDEDGGLLAGTIQADRMLYRADINLKDILLNSATGTTSLSSFDPDDPMARIKLDLDLKLSQPWRFDTNLLKLEGIPEGSFRVLGTLARPGLKGKMEFIPGGSLTNLLPAGDVVVERGSIDFTDPSQLNPFISVQGRVDVPPYLVNLNISGRVDKLNFVPSSTPSLRQDEIIAILVDPAAAPTIGATAAASSQTALNYGIASAGSGLIGTLALANLQEQLRRTFSLDRVSVSPRTGSTGTPEVSITLGESIYVLGRRVPLLYTYHQAGNLKTSSGKGEWRFGNYVLQFGVSAGNTSGANLTGEIRHTWSPK